MTSVLKMPFTLENGKDITISLADPKSGLTLTEVESTTNYIITENVIDYNGFAVTAAGAPYIYQTEKIPVTNG